MVELRGRYTGDNMSVNGVESAQAALPGTMGSKPVNFWEVHPHVKWCVLYEAVRVSTL